MLPEELIACIESMSNDERLRFADLIRGLPVPLPTPQPKVPWWSEGYHRWLNSLTPEQRKQATRDVLT